MNRNSVWFGIVIGALVPIVGLFLVRGLFDLLVYFNLMDMASSSISSRRTRTISLIAICLNILPMQIFNKRKHEGIIRGVSSTTMIWAGVWLYMFHDTLF